MVEEITRAALSTGGARKQFSTSNQRFRRSNALERLDPAEQQPILFLTPTSSLAGSNWR
jgi:hypothetical protein